MGGKAWRWLRERKGCLVREKEKEKDGGDIHLQRKEVALQLDNENGGLLRKLILSNIRLIDS